MIVYSLHCDNGHAFEGWFGGMAAFDQQQADGSLSCPVCASRDICKAPMAPALGGSVGERKQFAAPVPIEKGAPAQMPCPQTPAELHKMRRFMTGLRKYIQDNAEYVGPRFPEEARKIHYGETEERHIYGDATLEEAADLVEEGIDVAALPPDLSEAN